MNNNIVFVVIISDENQETTSIHSVYDNKDSAENATQELESVLKDMVVYYEQHELLS